MTNIEHAARAERRFRTMTTSDATRRRLPSQAWQGIAERLAASCGDLPARDRTRVYNLAIRATMRASLALRHAGFRGRA